MTSYSDNTRKPSITIKNGVHPSNLSRNPVLIIGQKQHLQNIPYDLIRCKLEPKVPEEVWNKAIDILFTSTAECVPLYLNQAVLAALPVKCSRHNAPSRSHSISKIVKTKSTYGNECVVLACEKEDVFASVCAVARSYPSFSKKTNTSYSKQFSITIEVLAFDRGLEDSIEKEDIEALNYVCEGIRLAAHIVDSPCDEMNTTSFTELIKSIGNDLGIETQVIAGEDLRKEGLGGIYGVGKAATHPPAMVILSHKNSTSKNANVAWVGKGIVYDTGGLSLKAKLSMVGMKRDCGGAAAILGAFYATVKSGFEGNLHAIFCLAENSIGPDATRPDDIHTLYSGRTVEINNTDAEGRLVLADGVAYAQKKLACSLILDMATLTGAQGVATGRYHGAILTNNEKWESHSVECGRISGDLLHPLPFSPELHFSEFNSTMADMKNSVADRSNATSSCAGLFIYSHLGFDWPGAWVHIDMASPVHNGERATGYGVALLIAMFSAYSQNSFIKTLKKDPQCLVENGTIQEEPEAKKFKTCID